MGMVQGSHDWKIFSGNLPWTALTFRSKWIGRCIFVANKTQRIEPKLVRGVVPRIMPAELWACEGANEDGNLKLVSMWSYL